LSKPHPWTRQSASTILAWGDSFDVGVTYIFDKHEEEDMLWVTDNLGTRREVLKERFKLPPEERKIEPPKKTKNLSDGIEDYEIPF
jgi:hypothetical protein